MDGALASWMRRATYSRSRRLPRARRRMPGPHPRPRPTETRSDRARDGDAQARVRMSRRVLVTGGAGFIGSHVAEHFLDDGWTVELLDNLSSGKPENVPSGARLHEGDIGSAAARRLVREGGFDVICHLAAQIDVRRSVMDPTADATTNILGTLNLVEGMREAGGRARFVASSTGGAIYGAFVDPPSG